MMQTKIWAHRGASHDFPENSMAAMQHALDCGADGIEIDVQRSKDGVIFVLHDENLVRLTGKDAMLKDCTAEEIRALELKSEYGPEGHYPIPTLEEMLEFLKKTDLTLNIELKNAIFLYPGLEEEVHAMVKEFQVEEQIVYSSFNHISMRKMAVDMGLGRQCGILYADYLYDDISYAKTCGVSYIHPLLNSLQKENFVENMHAADIGVHVWTVDDEEYIKLCLSMGVDAIITNEPAKALEMRKEILGY